MILSLDLLPPRLPLFPYTTLFRSLPPFRLFAGGWLGSGRQWFPWVHRDDVIGMIIYALENGAISGPVNVAGPEMAPRSEEHTSELQSRENIVCRLLLEKKTRTKSS